jgi:hypothetical protein
MTVSGWTGASSDKNCFTISLVSNGAVTSLFTFVLGQNSDAGPGFGFSPTLQREDGSYIGADLFGNVFAVGLDGSVVWQQQIGTAPPGSNYPPPVYPLYATADGGVIVTSTQPICPPGDGLIYREAFAAAGRQPTSRLSPVRDSRRQGHRHHHLPVPHQRRFVHPLRAAARHPLHRQYERQRDLAIARPKRSLFLDRAVTQSPASGRAVANLPAE